MVFNMDGFGGRASKISEYHNLAKDPRFELGMKLFYTQDLNLMKPDQVLRLRPQPDFVVYQ